MASKMNLVICAAQMIGNCPNTTIQGWMEGSATPHLHWNEYEQQARDCAPPPRTSPSVCVAQMLSARPSASYGCELYASSAGEGTSPKAHRLRHHRASYSRWRHDNAPLVAADSGRPTAALHSSDQLQPRVCPDRKLALRCDGGAPESGLSRRRSSANAPAR